MGKVKKKIILLSGMIYESLLMKGGWALLTKTCWRCIMNEELLCTMVLKAKYCPNKSLWEDSFRKGNSWFLERACGCY